MNDNKGYHGFHESYYEHRCPIIPEQDVLNTDIVGTGCASKIKRWWNDLFLLSSMSERSKGFYKSSHAMRIERFRQFRKYKSRIHPMSKFTNFWNTLMLVVFVMDKILFRFTSTMFLDDIPIHCYYVGAFLEIIIVLDLFIVMKTGYIDKAVKRVVLDTKKSLIFYCSNKLFLYTISAIPMHCFMFLRFGNNIDCGLCKSNMFICVIKIISAFSLYRIYELSGYWTWRHSSPKRRFVRIGLVGLMTMLQFYDLVDVMWILLILRSKTVNDRSFIAKLILIKYGKAKDVSGYMVLCFDISRIFKSLLLFSFGVKHSSYTLDKMASIIAYAIANCFFVWSLLECFMIISQRMYPQDIVKIVRCSIRKLLVTRQLPDNLKFKVDQYFEFKPTNLLLLEHGNDLHKSLPDVLKKEIILSCYSKRLMRLPLFNEWPLPMIEDMALMLKQEVYLGNDVVADAWVPSRGLMIVDIGVLAVYTGYHEEIGHLIDGDFFDEISLVTDKEARMSYILAATPCRVRSTHNRHECMTRASSLLTLSFQSHAQRSLCCQFSNLLCHYIFRGTSQLDKNILILDKFMFRNYMSKHLHLFYELKEKLLAKYERTSHETPVKETEESKDLSTDQP